MSKGHSDWDAVEWARSINVGAKMEDYTVKYASYVNEAAFIVGRFINDTFDMDILDYEDIWCTPMVECIKYNSVPATLDEFISLFINQSYAYLQEYIINNIDSSITDIYAKCNGNYEWILANKLNISQYYDVSNATPKGNLYAFRHDNFKSRAMFIPFVYNKTGNVGREYDVIAMMPKFNPAFIAMVNQLSVDALQLIAINIKYIKDQEELNSIMSSGPNEEQWRCAVSSELIKMVSQLASQVTNFDELTLPEQNYTVLIFFLKKGNERFPFQREGK